MIQAIFFDGTSSKGYPAWVEIASGGLLITFTKDGLESRLYWPIDEVRDKSEANSAKTVLAHGDVLPKYLEVNGKEFHTQLRNTYPAWNPSRSVVAVSSRFSVVTFVLLGFLVIGFFYVVLAHILPFMVEQAAIRMPWSWEKSMASGLKEQFLVGEEVNHPKTVLLNQFYQKLRPLPSEMDNPVPIQLTYVNDHRFNAFALPGREVVVFEGAIREMESYPELVALLGHECGHVEGRHSLRSIFRSLSTYLAISIFLGDVGGITAVLIENANTINNLSYSRDFEREADRFSHTLLCLNQVDPQGTVRLMKAMQEIAGDSESDKLSFMSSHPITSERIENAKAELKKHPCSSNATDPELERLFNELKKDVK